MGDDAGDAEDADGADEQGMQAGTDGQGETDREGGTGKAGGPIQDVSLSKGAGRPRSYIWSVNIYLYVIIISNY